MQILAKVSASVLIHATALMVLGTIFLCYGLAVGLGHVPAWLPMISDCAVLSPEKYPFRLGIVLGAALTATQVVMTYNADRPYSHSKTSLVLGLVASLGLGIVGVVNEKEYNPVHSGAAVVFFFCYEANMIVLSWFTPQVKRSLGHLFRELCAVIAGVALVAFVFMSFSWSKYSLYIAICEWVGTFCIVCFNWSFAVDRSMDNIAAAELQENSLMATETEPLIVKM